MTDLELSDKYDDGDAVIDRAIKAISSEPPPREAGIKIIAHAATWTPKRSRKSMHWAARILWKSAAAAALLLIAVSATVFFLTSTNHRPVITPRGSRSPALPVVELPGTLPATPASSEPAHLLTGTQQPELPAVELPVKPLNSPTHMGPRWVTSINVAVAENAPVIVANGGKDPIHLGAQIPQSQAGDSLHIWDWSGSPTSRVLPGVDLSGQRVLLLPDGKLLLWQKNELLDPQTGNKTPFALGEANNQIGEITYTRFGDLRFSPDASRLALLGTVQDDKDPRLITGENVQIVEFPSGKPLCNFPAGESYALRIAFSMDGKQIVSGDRSRQILLRDATTGKELRRFAPPLDRQIMGVAISRDSQLVAAYERTEFSNDPTQQKYGNLFIWSVASGQLLHRIAADSIQKLGGLGPNYGALRFSPDGHFLAAESRGRILVIDVVTGQIAAALREDSVHFIQWSADGKTITSITHLGAGEGGGDLPVGRYDIYPSVHAWDWPSGRRIDPFPTTAPQSKN